MSYNDLSRWIQYAKANPDKLVSRILKHELEKMSVKAIEDYFKAEHDQSVDNLLKELKVLPPDND